MSRNQRILTIVGALVVAVVAFIVLQPSEDDDDNGSSTTATVTQTVTEQPTTAPATTPTTETPTQTTTAPLEPEFAEIEVEGGQPRGGVQELSFEKGDRIRMRVRSDQADEIHIHGYNITKPLPAGQDVEVDFEAKLDGVFEVELHHSGKQIAELTVQP